MGPSSLAAIIEVMSGPDGSLPVELIRKAYRASKAGHVVLVLNGVSVQAIDRILDEVVADSGKVHGVLYADMKSARALVSRLQKSRRPPAADGPDATSGPGDAPG
jgi:hypothetical protein